MTKFKLLGIFLILTAAMLLGGCYTQVGMSGYERERYGDNSNQNDTYNDSEQYYDSESDTSYSEQQYDDQYYEDGTVVNNYYGYNPYRRYFTGYYPSISIGIGWGSGYYYDPFCYDPFYNYWCAPIYWSYDPFYSFPYSYYDYGYYSPYSWGGYYSGGSRYKERTNDMYRVRNGGSRNDVGLRTPLVTRNGSDSRGTLLRNSGGRENRTDGNTIRKRTDEQTPRTLRNPETTSRNLPNDRNNTEQKRIIPKRDGSTTNNPGSIDKRRQTNTGKREIKRDERRTTAPPKYQQPKKQTTPKTYSPPQRTYTPPRNTTPPPRSTGNTGGGNRNSGGGGSRNSGGNDSGRRTR